MSGPAAGGLAEHGGELPLGQRLALVDTGPVGGYRSLVDVLDFSSIVIIGRIRRRTRIRYCGRRVALLPRAGVVRFAGPVRSRDVDRPTPIRSIDVHGLVGGLRPSGESRP